MPTQLSQRMGPPRAPEQAEGLGRLARRDIVQDRKISAGNRAAVQSCSASPVPKSDRDLRPSSVHTRLKHAHRASTVAVAESSRASQSFGNFVH